MCVCVCACVRECVRECVRVHLCARASVRARVVVAVHVGPLWNEVLYCDLHLKPQIGRVSSGGAPHFRHLLDA